jgi:hypothetical protein
LKQKMTEVLTKAKWGLWRWYFTCNHGLKWGRGDYVAFYFYQFQGYSEFKVRKAVYQKYFNSSKIKEEKNKRKPKINYGKIEEIKRETIGKVEAIQFLTKDGACLLPSPSKSFQSALCKLYQLCVKEYPQYSVTRKFPLFYLFYVEFQTCIMLTSHNFRLNYPWSFLIKKSKFLSVN